MAHEVATPRVERRLAAILAADVFGYSRLMGADEEGTLARLKAHRREFVDPKIKERHGRIVKTTGDGMLVEFVSPVEAVRCAAEVQRGMVARNADLPLEKRITFRMGINLGDVIAEKGDLFGDGVNVAARLETLSEPGGVAISRMVRDQVRDKVPYAFEDMGEKSVKNIARPVRVYGLAADVVASLPEEGGASRSTTAAFFLAHRNAAFSAGLAGLVVLACLLAWVWLAPQAPPRGPPALAVSAPGPAAAASPVQASAIPRLSIVVLPFANLIDQHEEYFADGLTENLTTDLTAHISGLLVISRNSAFTYKGKDIDVVQIGKDLRVHYVLEGSVQRSGNQLRVNAQLIDAENGMHLWAARFDGDRTDLFALQDQITGRIANSLGSEMIRIAAREAEARRINPDAQDLVMRAKAVLLQPGSEDTLREAEALFRRAAEIDGQNVGALIGIATALMDQVMAFDRNRGVPIDAKISQASELIEKVLVLDPKSSDAHFIRGMIFEAERRNTEAAAEYEIAISLDRNNAGARALLAQVVNFLGDPEKAISQFEEAIRISPRDSDSFGMMLHLCLAHILLRHDDLAVEWCLKARALNPRVMYVQFDLAAAYGLRGDLEAARAPLAEALKLQPKLSIAWLRARTPSDNPRFNRLREDTLLVGLRKAGLREDDTANN
ncbi:TolB amino-terminal domain-containing protein [Rhizobiales bacterium GAS191]|nr:TolB amino-terminal domain-containing protein [Rhizobiales bacterium GAS191]